MKQQQLTEAAAANLADALNQDGILCQFDPTATRDWLAKVTIPDAGRVCVFANGAGNVTIRTHELTVRALESRILAAWNRVTDATAEVTLAETVGPIRAYVDGSYRDGKTGYSLVIVDARDRVIKTICGRCTCAGQQNIDGELAAAVKAVAWAETNGLNSIEIVHDYTGIAAFVCGQWIPRQPITQGYARRMKASTVAVSFTHVRGHAGNPRNQQADALAAKGRDLETLDFDVESLAELAPQVALGI